MLPPENEFLRKIETVAERDGRYRLEAYLFVYAALEYLVQKLKRKLATPPETRHVTGQELAQGIAEYAQEQYGPTAQSVFEYWGITSTLAFGHIVFNLVDEGLMSKTESDNLEDFRDVYDFKQTFDPKRIQNNGSNVDLERL